MNFNQCYFEHGQYYFGYEAFLNSSKEIAPENLISFDDYVKAGLSDVSEPGLLFVLRDKKYGVFTMHHGEMGGYGCVYSSNIFPFIYDEVWLNGNFSGDNVGYVAVRINKSWGILRVQDNMAMGKRRAYRPCMMIIPCIYPTRADAIRFIKSVDYHAGFGWRNPFETAKEHISREIIVSTK